MLLRFIIPCAILVYLVTLGFFHLHSKDVLSLRREYHLFEHEEVRRHIQKLHHGVDAQTFLKKRFHEIIPPSLPNYKPEQGLEPISPRIIPAGMVRKYLIYHSNKLEQNSVSNTTNIHVSNGNETKVPSIIYFVTPTYHRVTQMADLIRLSYTLDHDFAIYWIVVEDSSTCSKRIRDLLDRTGLPYAHLAALSPLPVPGKLQAKGVMQRNLALDVIEKVGIEGVVYFGDDDNAYDGKVHYI
jgi:Glycosyltransferase family 43